MSSIAVWVRLSELLIEYYELSVLRDIGSAIGSVLKIDTHITKEARGRFARLCVQVNFDKPLIKIIKTGGLEQPVQYEGINTLCFSCNWLGHKAESCPYRVRAPEKVGEKEEARKEMNIQSQPNVEEESFGSWVLIARKRQPGKLGKKVVDQALQNDPITQGPSFLSSNRFSSPFASGLTNEVVGLNEGQRKGSPTYQVSAHTSDNTKDKSNGEKTNTGVRSSSVRGINFGHKSKQNSRSQKGLRSKFSSKWKALSPTLVEEKSQKILEKENRVLPLSSEFMEFKVGLSTSDLKDKA